MSDARHGSLLARLLRRAGLVLEPLLDPRSSERRARDDAFAAQLGRLDQSLGHVGEQLERLGARIDKIDRSHVEGLQRATANLQWTARRQSAFADRLLHRLEPQREQEFAREHALRRIHQLARREGPVLVGPWTGEVGFELLYWIPFVRWAIHKHRINPARVTVLSRGGTASWYGLPGAHYLDVLTLRSADEFRERTEVKKQRTLRAFNRELIRQAAQRLGARPAVLHPAMMYAVYMPFWKQQQSRRWVEDCAEFDRIVPPRIEGLNLPRDYVAARFYFSECFPDTPDNRLLVASTIDSLSSETPVVLLGTGARVDDHHDFTAGRSDRVISVEHLMRPETNLAIQTAVIAGARAFVGTYGGYAYLAPLCGVNAVALFSQRTSFEYHLDYAQQMFEAVGGGTLTVVDAASRSLLRHLAAGVAVSRAAADPR